MARPKKPLAWHLLTNNYRPSRHGPLPGWVASPPEPRLELSPMAAFEALPADVRAWEGFLQCGTDFFDELPAGVTEARARRMARAKWREHGRALMAYWGPKRTRESWAYERFGEPSPEPELDPKKAALLAAWYRTFETGRDYFTELSAWGVVHPNDVRLPAKRPAAKRAFMAAARAAWAELGDVFLAQWVPEDTDDKPWALETFGSPTGPLKKPRKLRR
jgi:hypothetical protein